MSALATIHVAKKQLGLDDDTYRAVLNRVTGKTSSAEMTEPERWAVVDELRRLGFEKASSGSRRALEGRYAKKLQALWIAGWNLGVVRNRDDRALIAMVKRQTGIDHVRFVRDPADAVRAIEALKAMTAKAGVDWSDGNHLPDYARRDGFRIALAQWSLLEKAGLRGAGITGLRGYVAAMTNKGLSVMTDADWIPVMNALGNEVRKVKR